MKLNCANCGAEIKAEDINISTDLAKCYNCGAVHKASELTSSIKQEDLTPPNGSKITLNKGLRGEIELSYPRKGFSLLIFAQLFFALFWLGFIAFWTWGASQGSILFALFSIPFWLIGLSMIVGIINSVNEVQTISLNNTKLTVKRQRPIRPNSFEVDIKDIQSIKMKGLKMNPFAMFANFRHIMKMQRSFGSPIEFPAIITGKKTEYFFEDANDAEQEWVMRFLDGSVKGLRK